jgi:glycosyltransferase involved in cell wall biosynthesis
VNYASWRSSEALSTAMPCRAAPHALRRRDGFPAAETEDRRTAPAGPPLIVSVSRHDPRKGASTCCSARWPGCAGGRRFARDWWGRGRCSKHRRLAARLGLADRVALGGYDAGCVCGLAQADIFVSLAGGGRRLLALLEAFQASVAVVASRCDGIAKDVCDGGNGLLVPPKTAARRCPGPAAGPDAARAAGAAWPRELRSSLLSRAR